MEIGILQEKTFKKLLFGTPADARTLSYSCGADLQDLVTEFKEYEDVGIKEHVCNDPIEKLYYSAGFEPICIYCAKECPFTVVDVYRCLQGSPTYQKEVT